MATAPARRHRRNGLLSAADYLALPDDGNRYELVHGELLMSPSADYSHGLVVSFLIEKMRRHAVRRSLGDVSTETDMVISRSAVVRPDITFIAKARRSIVRGHIHGAPDVVVEVTSPDNWRNDLYEKRDLYEEFGVAEYWVFDIAEGRRRAFQWMLRGKLYHGGLVEAPSLKSRALRGFSVKLKEIWELA